MQVCNFNDRNHLPILHRKLPKNPPRMFTTSPSKKSPHIHRKFTEKSYTGTGSLRIRKHIRRKLIMTSTSSKLKYCIQKTTIQRDVGLRIYYFAYMNRPPLFLVPSIPRSCYSNYELKTTHNLELNKYTVHVNSYSLSRYKSGWFVILWSKCLTDSSRRPHIKALGMEGGGGRGGVMVISVCMGCCNLSYKFYLIN